MLENPDFYDIFPYVSFLFVVRENNVKSALSKKHIEECLSLYFAQNPEIDAHDVSNYILDKRVIKINESIRHKLQ